MNLLRLREISLSTGVGSAGLSQRPAILLALLASRRRGLPSSSMPVFSSTSAVPMSATARPGGTNHHQAPSCRACWLSAQ